ncbi:MAG TPA: DUF1611 domain-containing protein [Gammaproteobacteria bacterium]
MKDRYLFTSVARISDLESKPFDVEVLPRDRWQAADYVVGRVVGSPSNLYRLELTNGRLIDVMQGALVVGALGKRTATLEAVGDWEAIGADGVMDALTGAGLFGRATSVAPWLGRLISLNYVGHVQREGRKLAMGDFVSPIPTAELSAPVVLLIGTSMSSGKTTTGRVIIHELKRAGLRVAGAKFTGAGRYRDILSFQDAGADSIVDFVDAGLPSTVVSEDRFEKAMRYMLARVAETRPDVVVAEAGASPLEPYNGEAAMKALGEDVRCTVLCASDPYAVLGVQTAFGVDPDLVTGPAANTESGIELVTKLTGLPAMNLLREESLPRLVALLREHLPDGLLAA